MNPWVQAPNWANYRAQDRKGTWYWYQTKPEYNVLTDSWRCPEGGKVEVDYNAIPHWKDTLEGRPR